LCLRLEFDIKGLSERPILNAFASVQLSV